MLQHADSYYAATAVGARSWRSLTESLRCDVCVVGGGFTGLSAALHLAERDYDVVLLEAECIAWGASGRNGGQLGSGQRKDQVWLETRLGVGVARQLWDLAEEAKQTVRDRIARHGIACDLKPGILHAGHSPAAADNFAKAADNLRQNYQYEQIRSIDKAEIGEMLGTDRYFGGNLDAGAGHLHPMNYALGLARAAAAAGVRMFEGSRVTDYDRREPTTLRTATASVTANYVVLACNGYLETLEPRVAGRIMPINNFILATEPLGSARAKTLIRDDVAVADSKFVIDYYRLSADRRLLFGGGENYTRQFPRDVKNFVRKYMLNVYPELADVGIDYAWGGTLAVTLRRLPHFGRLEPNVYFAQGFSGQGVALTSLAGKLIAEAVAGTAERFDLFANLPSPAFPGGTLLRWPGLVLGMFYYSLRDRF